MTWRSKYKYISIFKKKIVFVESGAGEPSLSGQPIGLLLALTYSAG